MSGYRMTRLAAGRRAEIFLYTDVGSTWFAEGVTAKQFVDDLKALGNVDVINLRMNSAGGDVADGIAIYTSLKRHQARVEVDIDGMALSIASIIAMAGDEIRIAKNAMMMIHDPWGMAVGNAADLRKQADIMDQHKEGLVLTYADRTQRSSEDVAALMTAETWFTAREAFDAGFVDDITSELAIAACFNADRFHNVPAKFAKRMTNASAPTPRLDIATGIVERMRQGLRSGA